MLLASCATQYHMGDPIRADPKVAVASKAAPANGSGSNSQPSRSGAEKALAPSPAKGNQDVWEARWREIQGPADRLVWTDHFNVCALKYRFRNYDQFFRCLDLLETKIKGGGPRVPYADLVQQGAPVMLGWLRANAYAELGEPDTALKYAESAWSALPEPFRTADSVITQFKMFGGPARADLKGIYWFAAALGSGGFGDLGTDVEEGMLHSGRNNPAALDLRPPFVTMALAVQRALLYQKLGRADEAKAAMADLKRWENTRDQAGTSIWGKTSNIRPFVGTAQLLSIGPLFAQGDYARVVLYYEALAEKVGQQRQHESLKNTVNWTLFFPFKLMEAAVTAPINWALLPADARQFAVAVEDVSNALIYAQSLVHLGQIDKARSMLDTLLALPEIQAMGNLYWATLYERGLIALRDGQHEQGIRLLSQSVDAIESVRSTISFEAGKIGFAGDKQAVYATLIRALVQTEDWQQAFIYTERAKARALVDLLAERSELAPPPVPDSKVRELFAQAATTDSSVGIATDAESVRGIKVVDAARETLATVAPEAASLISVQKVSIAAIAARMTADESLIDYYVQGDDLFAFVLTGSSVHGTRIAASSLDEQVRAFREAIGRRDPKAAELSRSLYDLLIRPVLSDLKGSKLTIAPHGILHYLPFAALSDGEQMLLGRFSIRLIPSAHTLVYLRTDRPRKPGTILAVGNPDLGNRSLDLPNAQAEVEQITALFPHSRALVRAQATKAAVEELANGFAMLHFATHGRFDAAEPLSSGLYLAKGNEPDGMLRVGDLYSLRWDVDLVTLSACETGLGKVANGDDVIGLTRGFLYAGARSIVASLWEVDDAATAHLMESFYRNLQNNDKREALRLAQIETRQQFHEPWYWAAFDVLGRAD
jgi:CHAT domain-containing protein